MNCKGIIQSDGYVSYRKLESSEYQDIIRIPCVQHIKRKFIDYGKNDPDAEEIVNLLSLFYQKDRKHKIGIDDGWTEEKQLVYRQQYVPDILGELITN